MGRVGPKERRRDKNDEFQKYNESGVNSVMSYGNHQPPTAEASRRNFLGGLGTGLAGLALNALLMEENGLGDQALHGWRPPTGTPHFAPRAKSVIWLFMNGGVSHVESFDPKPELNKYAGKSIDETPHKD